MNIQYTKEHLSDDHLKKQIKRIDRFDIALVMLNNWGTCSTQFY